MNFQDLLSQYPRVVIAGAPRTGKTSFTRTVSDRPVIHTDDWMDWPWRDVPALVAAACLGLSSFVLEGVRAPDVLRSAELEVDVVLWLKTAKVEQTPAQKSMGAGVHTVLAEWAALHPDVPIVTEEQLDMPTLDHADVPLRTRRYATWTLDASRIERTPQGGIRVPARVSKAGVFSYKRGNRVLREYRPANELKKTSALASLKGAPVVVLHPTVNGGAVDIDNWKKLAVGHFEDPVWNEDTQAIEGFVVTNDAATIGEIERGALADISCAYDNGRDFTPGFTNGREPFDLTQTDFIFNQVALGPPGWGRQGRDVGLTLDADDNQVATPPPSTSEEAMDPTKDKNKPPTKDSTEAPPTPPPPADKAKTGDEGEALSTEEVTALRSIAKMLPALNKLINTGDPQKPPAKVELVPGADGKPTADAKPTADSPKATEDDDKKKTLDAADIERIAQEGIEVRTDAMAVLGSDYSPKGKSTRQVRVDVIRTFDSKFTADGRSEDSIAAAYDIALKAGAARAENAEALSKTRRHGTRTMDQGDPPARKPIGHQAYEAWKDAPVKH